jgi:hypothetical protein
MMHLHLKPNRRMAFLSESRNSSILVALLSLPVVAVLVVLNVIGETANQNQKLVSIPLASAPTLTTESTTVAVNTGATNGSICGTWEITTGVDPNGDNSQPTAIGVVSNDDVWVASGSWWPGASYRS